MVINNKIISVKERLPFMVRKILLLFNKKLTLYLVTITATVIKKNLLITNN
jgi:hypothetical protein